MFFFLLCSVLFIALPLTHTITLRICCTHRCILQKSFSSCPLSFPPQLLFLCEVLQLQAFCLCTPLYLSIVVFVYCKSIEPLFHVHLYPLVSEELKELGLYVFTLGRGGKVAKEVAQTEASTSAENNK